MKPDSAPGASERLYALDALRLVAALLVVLHHWNWVLPATWKNQSAYPSLLAAGGGYYGVSLFFIISGFVILMSAQGTDARGFVIARVVRLYPAFWVCCTMTWLVIAFDPMSPNLGELFVNLTMFPGAAGVPLVDGVYWTLALEARFYLLITVLLSLQKLHRIELVLWIWLALSQVALGYAWTQLIMVNWASFFVAGCACQLLRQRVTASRVGLLLAAGLVCLDTGSGSRLFGARADMPPAAMLGIGITALELLLILAVAKGWLRLRRSAFVLWAGAVSYPLYLLHKEISYRIVKGLRQDWQPGVVFVLAALAVLVLSAAVTHYEPRLQARLKKALRRDTPAGAPEMLQPRT